MKNSVYAFIAASLLCCLSVEAREFVKLPAKAETLERFRVICLSNDVVPSQFMDMLNSHGDPGKMATGYFAVYINADDRVVEVHGDKDYITYVKKFLAGLESTEKSNDNIFDLVVKRNYGPVDAQLAKWGIEVVADR